MAATRGQLARILDDPALFNGLEEPEAKLLVGWLSDWVEKAVDGESDSVQVERLIQKGWERGRAIRKVFLLWANPESRKNAIQLAATEKLIEFLPASVQDPISWWEITLENLGKGMEARLVKN
ncbi:MAG: hypothetical protein EXR99_05445 [Gemmataceae bacterium]|nr:hypothetical protein [Gemmataceae bacterium]